MLLYPRTKKEKKTFLAGFMLIFWWVFGMGEAQHQLGERRANMAVLLTKGERGASVAAERLRWLKNRQSRLVSRYVLVLPLGQTGNERLSQQSLAPWRTESGPGASEWRSEKTKGTCSNLHQHFQQMELYNIRSQYYCGFFLTPFFHRLCIQQSS